ncbi:SET domain-containing protein [Gymnopus androsaceus JB14]|uniref:SET domain-containing protein n=1 Tax=Gymnopus androsaceus JB14 TaxID=1447944 RepID=A0A6A4I557_9AGAR|nr:SET domain-containing protein [Gymnopus androsaceus JB14]
MQMNGNDDDDSDYSEVRFFFDPLAVVIKLSFPSILDIQRHVEHMVDVRNEPGSPLSSVSSMARAVDLTEPMVEVPVTDTELPERSRSSSSQASTTDVAKRRWPSRNTKSRRASSSYSSVSEYDRTLLGNYDSTSSASSIANESPPRSTTPEDEKDHLPPLSYGGLPVFTWARRRASLRYEPPRYRLSKDLSHVMHDYINAYDPGVRNHPQMQEVYEWMIQENTCLDEPDAPVIKVINQTETALTEPTPPWEFVYTNEMWLGQDVSPPSRENLVACDCEGKCTRNTCKCWKKQEAQTADFDVKGFMYDQNGLLKRNGLPVFECNSLCNCGEECKNRVVSQGRKSERIPKGMFIGIYSGELLGHAESEERAVKYDEFGRTYLFDIDWWYITAEVEAKEAKEKKDAAQMAAENGPEPTSDLTLCNTGEKRRPSKYTVDAYHAGNFTRFLNHSCDPNAALTPVYIDEADIERPLLTIFSKREIKMNEEITFSYSGDPDEDSDNEEMLPLPQTPRRGQKGKNAHKPLATPKKKGKKGDARVHVDCECKSLRCKGTIWRYD